MSSRVTVAGAARALLEWTLRAPWVGVWRAELVLESTTEPVATGAEIVLSDDLGSEWHGTVRAATRFGSTEHLEVMAGAGALNQATQARFYAAGVDAGSVLTDLCGDVGETADSASVQPLPQWRTQALWLADEVETLARFTSGLWRVLPTGEISLSPPDAAVPTLGDWTNAERTFRVYDCPDVPPVLGATIDGWQIGQALYQAGSGRATLTVWERIPNARPVRRQSVGATVVVANGQRLDVLTDEGLGLRDVPLWSVAGYVPNVRPGSRVLILDLGDDPRATIAFCGAFDATIDGVTLAQGESELLPSIPGPLGPTGRVVRYGDMVVFPVGVAATPTAMPVQAAFPPGPPVPVSRVKG